MSAVSEVGGTTEEAGVARAQAEPSTLNLVVRGTQWEEVGSSPGAGTSVSTWGK